MFDILLGASLVSIGVLASALADRIRGIRLVRERRDHSDRTPAREAKPERGIPHRAATDAPRVTSAGDRLRNDVALALTTAGYAKADALDAVDACAGSERATLESWTRAAFRRCLRQEAA